VTGVVGERGGHSRGTKALERLKALERALKEGRALDSSSVASMCSAMIELYEQSLLIAEYLLMVKEAMVSMSEYMSELVSELIGYLPALRGTALRFKAEEVKRKLSELGERLKALKELY